MRLFFNYLVFPGFLFSVFVGLLAGWFDRKVSARVQWRRGPPWHQNITDIIKLFGKETIVPSGAGGAFLLAPYLGLLGIVLCAAMVGGAFFFPSQGFAADLIVVVYLLAVPAIATLIGASSSRNPLASVGASREIKLLLAYELPFILAIITVAVKSGGALTLSDIVHRQQLLGSTVASASGALAALVGLICLQAKLGLAPFDIAEADQELMCGTLIEYSGVALALFKMIKAVLLTTAISFFVLIFMARDTSPLFLALKFTAVLTVLILIKNTNPRLRIDQAVRFFWGPVAAVGAIGLTLALMGF